MSDVAGYANRLLDEARGELTHADSKASILVGTYGVAGGVVLAAIIAGDWSPSMLNAGSTQIVWWVASLAYGAGLFAAGLAVYPRTDHDQADVVYFWGHVVALGGGLESDAHRERVRKALTRAATDPEARAIDQLIAVAAILKRKYTLIRRSLSAALLSGALYVIMALVELAAQ